MYDYYFPTKFLFLLHLMKEFVFLLDDKKKRKNLLNYNLQVSLECYLMIKHD